MAFTPRTFEQILTDMIAYVQSRTTLSDFQVGSVIRTILEAAALEDDEQYFQMVQLLDAFSLTTASGEDLDRRLADFGITRESAKRAFGQVRFFNSNLTTDDVASDELVGATSVQVFDSGRFPITGFPYILRIAEGTARVQDVSVTANNTTSNTFTLDTSTPLLTDIFVADRVALVTGAASQTINSGTTLQAPPTVSERAKNYTTQQPSFILAGNLFSNEVLAKATDSGTNGNVGVGRVTKFVGSPPFSGGRVENTTNMGGGTNRESDEDFRARALERIQTLSRGTPRALRGNSIGIEDPGTGQRVTSANIQEAFDLDEVIVYIDDGTGLEPDLAPLPADSLSAGVSAGFTSIDLNNGTDFPSSGYILIEAEGTNLAELVEVLAHPQPDRLTLATGLVNDHGVGAIVNFVDVISTSSESGQRRFRVQNFPTVRSTDRIFVQPTAGPWAQLVRGVDYVLNKGTGEFIVLDTAGLSEGTQVVAHYTYYTNLVAEVQKVLEGDPGDSVNFPGVKAAGIFLSVEAPIIKRITVRATITAEDRFTEADIAPSVRRAIEDYINARKIGEDVIRAKMVDVAYNVSGVKDISVTDPISNITVLENELPVPFDSDGDSLVTVL
jgi:uncharacterized phage protein gp47/JayE